MGIAGDLAYKDEQTMKRLLLLDYFRGPDSTGFAAIKHNGDAKISKVASNPLDLFEMASFKAALSGSSCKAFIGHNRMATRGGVNTANAHPFQYDHIIGAHNGTLDLMSTGRLEDALGEKFSVDSQALFAAIAKLGIKATIKLCTTGRDSHTGAWSLVWYDQNEGSLNFLRNDHRPMWYAYSDDFKQVFYASEWQMIEAAVKMSVNGYKLYQEDKTNYQFWATPVDTHLKFDLDVLKKGGASYKPKAVEIKGREPVPVVSTTGQDPFYRNGTGGNSGKNPTGFHTTPSSTTNLGPNQKHSSKDSGEVSVVHLLGDIGKPLAGYIDPIKFHQLSKYGCCWCGGDVQFNTPGVTIYDRDDLLLCPPCSGHVTTSEDVTLPASRIIVSKGTLDSLAL